MTENQNIEYKQSWRDEYLKWICGFANAQGGIIYIGKNDSGNVVHLPNFKKLMDDIPNKIRNSMGIICDVQLNDKSGKKYISNYSKSLYCCCFIEREILFSVR